MKTYRLVQFHTDTISPLDDSPLSQYYQKIWKQKHYYKPDAFWELPKWIGELSYCLEKASISHDIEVLTSVSVLRSTFVFGSVLQANKALYEAIIDLNPSCTFILGGYTSLIERNNVVWCNSIKDACDYLGIEYHYGVSWNLFKGTKRIPRITMSTGCRHKCKFCTIPNEVIPVDKDIIDQQIEALKPLRFDLVYIDDKTFGQCENYEYLRQMYEKIKVDNKYFQGFIVQTTASEVPRIPFNDLHIYAVEIGVESFNDYILKTMRKPATEKTIERAEQILFKQGVKFIPNIIVGIPQETVGSYIHTMMFLKSSRLLHANLYNLAVYQESDLAKEISIQSDDDGNEMSSSKSFNCNYINQRNNNVIQEMAKILL